MHRIHPPARSLDLVVRDFASINLRLRQHRASSFFAQHHSRRLFHAGSTEPFRLHIETEELGDRRWRDDAGGLRITGYGDGEQVEVGQALPLEVEEGDGKWRDDGWHAEVEVKAPMVEVGAGLEEGVEKSGMKTAAAAVGTSAALVSGHSPAGGSKSRAESRLLRRQRRELAGNYKPAATAREQQPAREQQSTQDEINDKDNAEGHDSVLSMIEKMDGPSLSKPNSKTTTPKPEKLSDEAFAALKAERKAAREAKMKQTSLLKTQEYKTARDKRAAAPVPKAKREDWQVQKSANLSKFGDAVWQPRKRLSPDTLEGIRALHASDPVLYSTETLSNQFEVSAENIRRILKSKWRPNDEERDERSARWERRGVRKWTEMAELGERPPRRWREMGVGSVKGEPERRPGWKRGGGGKKMERGVLDADWEGEEFGERIL
ncbi:hypothetical protein Q7P36_004736 [Cladosporium allicinum]